MQCAPRPSLLRFSALTNLQRLDQDKSLVSSLAIPLPRGSQSGLREIALEWKLPRIFGLHLNPNSCNRIELPSLPYHGEHGPVGSRAQLSIDEPGKSPCLSTAGMFIMTSDSRP